MSHWTDLPMLALDTETTGVDVFDDRIVEIAAAIVMPDGTVAGSWCRIVNPGVDIPDGAAEIHGITTARAAKEGTTPVDALGYVAVVVQNHLYAYEGRAAVVMFNAKFDWPLILTEAERHGVEFPATAAILDPFLIDKMVDRYRKGSRKLIDVAAFYGVELAAADAHGAAADAVAAGRVMHQLAKRHPEMAGRSLASMWLRQVLGAEAQRAGLEEYLRRKDPKVSIPPGWPIPCAREAS